MKNYLCGALVLLLFMSCDIPGSHKNTSMEYAEEIATNGKVITASIDDPTESHFYKFYGLKGYGYEVNVIWVSGESFDILGRWYAYNGYNFHFQNTTGPKGNETDTIDFHDQSACCYLEICDYWKENSGIYTISVTRGSFGSE